MPELPSIDEIMHAARFQRSEENGIKIRKGMAERARLGGHNGPLPLGYRYREDGLRKSIVPDAKTAPLIREAFKMAASGYPIRRIIREVSAMGLTSIHRKPFGPSSMLKVLRNPFFAGQVGYAGKLAAGNHPALVDRRTFDIAQRQLTRKRRNNVK
jgi:site-specific DNA recombinase